MLFLTQGYVKSIEHNQFGVGAGARAWQKRGCNDPIEAQEVLLSRRYCNRSEPPPCVGAG